MQAAYEFGLLSELADVGAGQHPDGEDGEYREASAPEEYAAGALVVCHGQHLGDLPQYDMSCPNSSGSPS